ncbi:hypothetical protein SDC9_99943 [bioreactor metagenome]|uniref:Uncharacterized protein n=1 Tax=bioreactor metagenome TaxID=1076179 RepID=A0A645AKC0_9ZZZZ
MKTRRQDGCHARSWLAQVLKLIQHREHCTGPAPVSACDLESVAVQQNRLPKQKRFIAHYRGRLRESSERNSPDRGSHRPGA